MIDAIRNELRSLDAFDQWSDGLNPVRKDVTQLIQNLETGENAQVQLFYAVQTSGSIRCGLEVVHGKETFRDRLADSIREYFSSLEGAPSLATSRGATICRLKDKANSPRASRLQDARTFYEVVNQRLNEWVTMGFPKFAAKETIIRLNHRSNFETYLNESNAAGSGKASSYLRALDLLVQMLKSESYGFEDCQNIWSINSTERLLELRQQVLEEQKKGGASPWVQKSIPESYLLGGYCSAALSQLIEFIPQESYASKVLEIYRNHSGTDVELAAKLKQVECTASPFAAYDPDSKDGQDRIVQSKARNGQYAFRRMILENYGNRCCITGLDIPTLNRASHIIGWAEREETRMFPSNGLCLSATYDAAFDKHLISLDDAYCVMISKKIKRHYSNESVEKYFEPLEGMVIDLPHRNQPSLKYLEHHRNKGWF